MERKNNYSADTEITKHVVNVEDINMHNVIQIH